MVNTSLFAGPIAAATADGIMPSARRLTAQIVARIDDAA
jgi:hypothetical protein